MRARAKRNRVNPLIIPDSCPETGKSIGRSRRIGNDFGIGRFSYGEYVPKDTFFLRSRQDIGVRRRQTPSLTPPAAAIRSSSASVRPRSTATLADADVTLRLPWTRLSKYEIFFIFDLATFSPATQSSIGFVLAPVLPPAAATWSISASVSWCSRFASAAPVAW